MISVSDSIMRQVGVDSTVEQAALLYRLADCSINFFKFVKVEVFPRSQVQITTGPGWAEVFLSSKTTKSWVSLRITQASGSIFDLVEAAYILGKKPRQQKTFGWDCKHELQDYGRRMVNGRRCG